MKLVLAPQSTNVFSDWENSDSVVLRIKEFAEYEGSSAGRSDIGSGNFAGKELSTEERSAVDEVITGMGELFLLRLMVPPRVPESLPRFPVFHRPAIPVPLLSPVRIPR